MSSKEANTTAVWVAIIGGLISAVGYVGAYFKDISLQEKKQKHELIINLLREDPFASSRNLIWANNAGLIELSEDNITKLKNDPIDAPTASSIGANPSNVEEFIAPSSDISRLIADLDGVTLTIRTQSLKALLDNHLSSNDAVKAAIGQLSGEKLNLISLNGRYNVLYFLERVNWANIEPALKESANVMVDNILDRHDQGIAIAGKKTRSQISQIKKLVK